MTIRVSLRLPGLEPRWIDWRGRVTRSREHADHYRPALSDAPTAVPSTWPSDAIATAEPPHDSDAARAYALVSEPGALYEATK